jgi:NAD+ kinase
MQPIERVAIVSKPGVPAASKIVPEMIEWLSIRGIEARCDLESAAYAGRVESFSREEVADGVQLVVVLGGDGTLLSAARAVGGRDIPLLAVNLGGLGFLTAITVDEIYPELERALRGEHRIGQRRMLHCELIRNDVRVASYEALNDVVFTKTALARMIDLAVNVDAHFVCEYKADGLIVCTPTGSTAYSLSAGGPIIFPKVDALCLTPICPHMLTNRPVIVPAESVIQVLCHAADDEAFLTVDGQVGGPLRRNDCVECRSSAHSVQLIRPPRMLYFDVLRQKLKWGER